jgi:hypothetical protein
VLERMRMKLLVAGAVIGLATRGELAGGQREFACARRRGRLRLRLLAARP